jgi:hypothetical protein
MIIAIIYLLAVVLAELVTTGIFPFGPLAHPQPVWGIMCHIAILVAALLHSALGLSANNRQRQLVLSLALVPLVRIISLSMPLVGVPQLWWYPIIYIPLMAAALVAVRILGYRAEEVGFAFRLFPVQIAVGLTGIVFGIVEYLILASEAIVAELTWQAAWLPALILLVTTGFVEEFIFRGVLQRAAVERFQWRGMLYVSVLFAVLHVGFLSWLDVIFVFSVALFFSWVVKKTGSLFGVTLSHGITNIMLFLVVPFFF